MSTEEIWSRRNFFEKSQEKKHQVQAIKDQAQTPVSPVTTTATDFSARNLYKRPSDPRIFGAQASTCEGRRYFGFIIHINISIQS